MIPRGAHSKFAVGWQCLLLGSAGAARSSAHCYIIGGVPCLWILCVGVMTYVAVKYLVHTAILRIKHSPSQDLTCEPRGLVSTLCSTFDRAVFIIFLHTSLFFYTFIMDGFGGGMLNTVVHDSI